MPDASTPPEPAVRVTDVRALRALAHPLRSRLLGQLRLHGPATASQLGRAVGESSGSTSYHLRQLASYGFVADAEGEGSGRERWWRATHLMTSWEPDELVGQPGGREANEQMQRLQVDLMGRELRAWLDRGSEHGQEWAGVAGMSDYVLRLTPPEAKQLLTELYAVLDRWSGDHRDVRPGAAAVNLFVAGFPRVGDDTSGRS